MLAKSAAVPAAVVALVRDEEFIPTNGIPLSGIRTVEPPLAVSYTGINIIRMVEDHADSQLNEIDRDIAAHEDALVELRARRILVMQLRNVVQSK